MATKTGKYRKYCDVCGGDKHWIEYPETVYTEDGYKTTCKKCLQIDADKRAKMVGDTIREQHTTLQTYHL